jgi:hypothetical protein
MDDSRAIGLNFDCHGQLCGCDWRPCDKVRNPLSVSKAVCSLKMDDSRAIGLNFDCHPQLCGCDWRRCDNVRNLVSLRSGFLFENVRLLRELLACILIEMVKSVDAIGFLVTRYETVGNYTLVLLSHNF